MSDMNTAPSGSEWHELVGNLHMHTIHSDGTGAHQDLVKAAQANRLDFIIATDHNVLVSREEGWRERVLLLVGEEVNDANLQPEGNHCLVLGVESDVTPYAAAPQELLNAAQRQGAVTFLAHPIERPSPLLPDTYQWRNWEVNGFTGIELWNFMSEFRYYAWSKPWALLTLYLPRLFTTGPWPEMIAKWDELLATRPQPIVAIGGSDAHAHTYRLGPLQRLFLSYQDCFAAVNTHLLAPEPFNGDLAHDRRLVYDALRAGHAWVGYDLPGATRGFRFTASNGTDCAIMGDALAANGQLVRFDINAPGQASVRLLRNGQLAAQTQNASLRYASYQPGIYRVEVWRRAWGKARGWIFSNPIYVN